MLQAFDPSNPNPNYHLQKFIALVMLTVVCALHMFSRKMGIALNNFLAIYKVSLVLFIIIIGFAAMAGARRRDASINTTATATAASGTKYGLANLSVAEFAYTEAKSMQEYASAILGVLWAYTGWENANYVLSEVKRPPGHESRVFKVSAFASIGTLTTLYVLANISYFAVLTREEILAEGDLVAAKFFVKVLLSVSLSPPYSTLTVMGKKKGLWSELVLGTRPQGDGRAVDNGQLHLVYIFSGPRQAGDRKAAHPAVLRILGAPVALRHAHGRPGAALDRGRSVHRANARQPRRRGL